ncbi:nuclear transport factor 2 family protein [Novosphingobium beihaiensis]|uniref:Nuclear transport factor 2 family protein n=1 Tax=Novosphingobium beihaiensis TaxID=2930389 RepID=A0ABT0BRI3_9SPHN|nr:nuclear transport factor 2 family protein [Novosphingobium beihaiensis]MCJ2187667.1 nuclear transport factor 2 family protein [Novosphingobium beihaiensis]
MTEAENTPPSLDPRVAALLDKEAIRTLRLHYSALLDGGQASRMDEVFTEDAEVAVTVGTMKGLAEIRKSLAEAFVSFDTLGRESFPFLHAVANHQITLTGPDTAQGSCYLLDFVTDRPEERHPFLLLGLYRDQYLRTGAGWRIACSRLDVLWPHEN